MIRLSIPKIYDVIMIITITTIWVDAGGCKSSGKITCLNESKHCQPLLARIIALKHVVAVVATHLEMAFKSYTVKKRKLILKRSWNFHGTGKLFQALFGVYEM